MGKCYLLFLALVFNATSVVQAKIWRVNNNAGIVADFTDAQSAQNGAMNGDTIHLEPSVTSYGPLSMGKRLVIISTGQFIVENPGFQFDRNTAFLDNIYVSPTASYSTLMVRFSQWINIANATGVTISNCAAQAASLNGGIIIQNCQDVVIRNSIINFIQISSSRNFLVLNNIISFDVSDDISSDGAVINNVIYALQGRIGSGSNQFNNCTIENNIFNRGMSIFQSNCIVNNNLANLAFAPSYTQGSNNRWTVNMITVFVNSTGGFLDNVYQLQPGSPAIGAGKGGIDCGAFGGSSPFTLAVTPPIPSIYDMVVPHFTSGNIMNVQFSTKSN